MSTRIDTSGTIHYEIFCTKHGPQRNRDVQIVRGDQISKNKGTKGRFKSVSGTHTANDSVSTNSRSNREREEGQAGMRSGGFGEHSSKCSPIVLLSSPCDGLQDTAEKSSRSAIRSHAVFSGRTGASPKRKRSVSSQCLLYWRALLRCAVSCPTVITA